MEEWKQVEGHEEKYIVSSEGRVAMLLLPDMSSKYARVTLGLGRRRQPGTAKVKKYLVHRLVAQVFIKKSRPKQDIVNHLDGDRLNNCKENLEWCTREENDIHSTRNGLRKAVNKTPKIIEDRIIAYYLKTGLSQEATGKHFGYPQTTVGNILRRRKII